MTNPEIWTPQRIEVARRAWQDGVAYDEMPRAVGVGRVAMRAFMKENEDIFPKRKAINSWTDAMIDLADRMWKEGHSTASMGQALGTSKNAVIGMMARNRDRFEERSSAPRLARAKREAVARVVVITTTVPVIAPSDYDHGREGKELWQLGNRECKWPINDGKPFLFCAAEVGQGNGRNYCTHHHDRAFREVPAYLKSRNLRPMYRDR